MFNVQDLIWVLPEIVLLTLVSIVLVVDLFLADSKRLFTQLLSVASLLVVAALVWDQSGSSALIFSDSYRVDGLAQTLKLSILLISALVLAYSGEYLRDRGLYKGEYFVLSLFAVLGMLVMVSANSFLLIYLGLELLSLALYALVAFNRDNERCSEAAMKYFVLGALASGMLLYGLSILYGLTGSLLIPDLVQSATETSEHPVAMAFAMTFVIVGLAFKLGAVPFHMWIPDVYQGAPTPVTLMIGTAPKIAGFAIMLRLLAEGLGPLHTEWMPMLMLLAVASLFIGNVIALAQTNFKRLLAYSTISHVGFILMGILSGTSDGYAAAMFYTITYALTAAVGFGVIVLLSRQGFEAEELSDLSGLNDRNPWMAAMLGIALFSMAGVPPTVGFYAKLAVLNSVIQIGQVWLALVAVVFSVIGLFYYLRAIKVMYFDKTDDETLLSADGMDKSLVMRSLLSVNSLSLLILGLLPAGLMSLCLSAFQG